MLEIGEVCERTGLAGREIEIRIARREFPVPSIDNGIPRWHSDDVEEFMAKRWLRPPRKRLDRLNLSVARYR